MGRKNSKRRDDEERKEGWDEGGRKERRVIYEKVTSRSYKKAENELKVQI